MDEQGELTYAQLLARIRMMDQAFQDIHRLVDAAYAMRLTTSQALQRIDTTAKIQIEYNAEDRLSSNSAST